MSKDTVSENKTYRNLTDDEIKTLAAHHCRCDDWSRVQVAEGFDAARVCGSSFSGDVRLGANGGTLSEGAGPPRSCGVYGAMLHDCTVGDDCRIAKVGLHVAGYEIGDGAWIENVGRIETGPDATFGSGVEVEALNEGGGREIALFERLNSQFAYLMCVHRHRTATIEKLEAMAKAEAARVAGGKGTIGAGARIFDVKKIVDVRIGPAARIDGASSLKNGSILSSPDAPTVIGADVVADNFIVAESTKVTDGAVLGATFVGQGCQIGKQFSSEGSVFFANCEGFHGEACSIFAGPYTVTHHKSTLLIAGQFSFYNAGSGTNQSNHLYKLGPVHEGKLERGCKTGSFSYMMWPCRVGPFSVVLGKHTSKFDTADFPFSYLEAMSDGRCSMVPGLNLVTVGTVRDGAKWPTRDRRKGSVKRDRLSFDVFSPLTVGRMIRGSARMKELKDTTDRSVDTVMLDGACVKRLLLNTGIKTYRSGTHMYLYDKVFSRLESGQSLDAAGDAVFSEQWVDAGGQLMPQGRLDALCAAIESGEIADVDAFEAALDQIAAAYAEDEWAWVRWAYERVFGASLAEAAKDPAALADGHLKARGKFLRLVLNDATKEFDDAVRLGFGQDGDAEAVAADFAAVRGTLETNGFVKQMNEEIAALEDRVAKYKATLG